jgi:hypothetical protein
LGKLRIPAVVKESSLGKSLSAATFEPELSIVRERCCSKAELRFRACLCGVKQLFKFFNPELSKIRHDLLERTLTQLSLSNV